MTGWRARIGFLVPPGNPTVEPEMTELAPAGVSVHFTRMSASGSAGTHSGQDERTREQIASLDDATRLMAMIPPQAIVLAHTPPAIHSAVTPRRLWSPGWKPRQVPVS